MTADPIFFGDLAIVLVAALLGAAAAWLTRQPLILGYVLGGLLVGPFTPGPTVSDLHTFELFAEIGVVLLMFSIGMEFSLTDLLRVKWVALIGGPLGILISAGLGVGVAALTGWSLLQGAVIGIVVSVASTMVLARLLIDRGELHSRHGRVMIGITLVEDLAVVVLTVLLPELGALSTERVVAIAGAVGRAALVLVPFAYVAAKVIPPLMRRVARTQNDELFLILALSIGLGTAALTQAVGLSLALGAFLGGLLLGNSDYSHEALARLLPLRDVFVALFFVTVGALVDPRNVLSNLPLLGVMLALIVVGKLVIKTAVVAAFGYPLLTALLVGVGLTQIGEFSYILVQVARDAGQVGDDVYNATLAASLLSILINAPLVRHAPRWLTALGLLERGRAASRPPAEAERGGHVVLCGFGRVGSAVGEALTTFGLRYTVIERDPDVVKGLVARGVPALYGDAGRRSSLERAGVHDAALLIVALPDVEHARLAVRAARTLNAGVPVLVRAHGRAESDALTRDGASEVIQPELEAAGTLIRRALARLQLPKSQALAYLERFRDAMESAQTPPVGAEQPLPEVREVSVSSDGVADQSLRESGIRERFGVTVVAVIKAGDIILNPPPDTVLRPGDRVRLFGLPGQIDRFVRETTPGR